jgi:hypothetical protein
VRLIRVITETDIPIVFHTEFVELAEVGTATEVEEGAAVDCQEVIPGAVRCAVDGNSSALGGDVDDTPIVLVGEDEVWVRDGDDVGVDEVVDGVEELLVVGLFGGNRAPPRSGRKALVVVVES